MSPCHCLSYSKLTGKQEVSKSSTSQKGHKTTPDNILVTVRIMQSQKQPRKQQTHKKIDMRSDWSDSDDDKDSQARGRPMTERYT